MIVDEQAPMIQTMLPLGTKACVPALPPSFIRRSRLERALSDDARRPVTLVTAGPGCGKTTLLAGWFGGRRDGGGAWLTLDTRDNDAERLTRAVLCALARAGVLPEPNPSGASGLTELDGAFERIATDARRVLVLDDAEALTSPQAIAVLSHLVERKPAGLDVVIATRADPPISLARLRLAGRIGEVRSADLAFTLAETSMLFDAEALGVEEDDVRTLWRRTEGWAAGLRLAACSLERGADPQRLLAGVGAESSEVMDYLLHEVLLRQHPEVQDLLLRTSIVDRPTSELAAVLSEDPDAGRRLAELEHRGVFLTRVDGAGGFRYHPLLATLLRGRLRQRDPELASALRRRAARWYADHGMAFEAEELAQSGGHWDLLGDLLAHRWLEAVLEGDDAPPTTTSGMPRDAISMTPMLSLVAAAEACSAHDAIAAERHRRRARSGPADPGCDVVDALSVVSAVVDVLHGCAFGADERAEAGARYLNGSERADARIDHFVALRRAEMLLDVDDLRGAQRELEPLLDVAEPHAVALESRALLALLHALSGRLGPAAQFAGEVLASKEAAARARGTARLAATLVASQRGEAHGADGRPSDDGPQLPSRPLRAVERAVTTWLAGGSAIVGLDGATARHPLAGRALVALGVLEVVDTQHRVVGLGGPAEAAVRRTRRALSDGAHAPALAAAEPWIRAGAADVLPRTRIEAGVLAAVARTRQGQYGAANDLVRTVLTMASVEGTVAPLISHGATLVSSLEHLSNEIAPHQQLAIRLLDAVRQMQPLAFADPLTDRERVVLGFLPTMMTNAEIATSMHLSVNTIKTHLKALYRKLNVERRRDAVVRARQLDLL